MRGTFEHYEGDGGGRGVGGAALVPPGVARPRPGQEPLETASLNKFDKFKSTQPTFNSRDSGIPWGIDNHSSPTARTLSVILCPTTLPIYLCMEMVLVDEFWWRLWRTSHPLSGARGWCWKYQKTWWGGAGEVMVQVMVWGEPLRRYTTPSPSTLHLGSGDPVARPASGPTYDPEARLVAQVGHRVHLDTRSPQLPRILRLCWIMFALQVATYKKRLKLLAC